MFKPQTNPRVMALPIGCDFSTAFVMGLRARMASAAPQDWAHITIFVNTRRSARRLLELLSVGAVILPEIRVIGDLASDHSANIPKAASPLDRQLLLADLIGAFLENQQDLAPKSAMFDLAKSLASLLDELDGEGVSIDALNSIDVDRLSGHWQRSLTFLNILKDYVSALTGKMSGSEARQRAMIAALAAEWAENPPKNPVIIAGSTGSRGATAMFIKAVASLPQGAVVLPGFDFLTPRNIWPLMAEEHPQFGFAALGEIIGFDPVDMPKWHDATPINIARNALLSLSLRPAPVTAEWLSEGPKLLPELAKACENLTMLEAQNPRLEATAIAIKLRQALQQGQKSALITPDRTLARRVSAMLKRWDIVADDSAGQPARLSPPGMLLRMVAGLLGTELTPLKLLELLKHPLCSIGERNQHLKFARRLEIAKLRGGPAFVDLDSYDKWAEENAASEWLSGLKSVLLPLNSVSENNVSEWAIQHQKITESLAKPDIWDQEAGRITLQILQKLQETNHETPYGTAEYRILFNTVLQQAEIRSDPVLAHPDLAIWGTLEARVQSADLIILAGLNDGVWPQISRNDTWLNRDMRGQIGLQLPERRIGLSAHDFQQSLGAAEVVLSRSIRDGDAPTVPSRWLMRLQNLTAGLGETGVLALQEMRIRGEELLDWAMRIDMPVKTVTPALRPAPAPPISARPKGLYVTRIETLIRDPYAIYAQYTLNLRKFQPLTQLPDARAKGIVLHDILEQFVRETQHGMPDDAVDLFDQILADTLQKTPWPATRRLWRASFLKTRDWFLQSEFERRENGRPQHFEAKGTRQLPGDFSLSAKADRIDIDASGSLLIYDYKSGAKPSEKQIRQFSVQLPLEGLIAESGGFNGISAGKIRRLQLVYLGGEGDTITFDETDDALQNAWENLCSLIARYQSDTIGYAARLRPELSKFDGDYDHLARRGEWQDDDGYTVEIL